MRKYSKKKLFTVWGFPHISSFLFTFIQISYGNTTKVVVLKIIFDVSEE